MSKDPGQQAIAYCAAKYSSMVDDFDFFEGRKDELIAEAMLDCTEALIKIDEIEILETLATIGNRALRNQREGDTDDKLAFVDEVCNTVFKLINKHAEAQASLDLERRWGSKDNDPFQPKRRRQLPRAAGQ